MYAAGREQVRRLNAAAAAARAQEDNCQPQLKPVPTVSASGPVRAGRRVNAVKNAPAIVFADGHHAQSPKPTASL